jgi:hypothetical protein
MTTTPAEELDGLMKILNTIDPTKELPSDLSQQIQESPLMKPNEFSSPSDASGATLLPPLTPGFDSTSPAQPAKDAKISLPSATTERVFSSPTLASVSPPSASIATTTAASGLRILLTGRSGVGKTWLASAINAEARELVDPVLKGFQGSFPSVTHKSVDLTAQTVLAWGRGIISDSYPVSPARLLFIEFAGSMFGRGFGDSPDFWAKVLVSKITDNRPVVVTSVTSSEEFQYLTAAGFEHYHVVCSSSTLVNRPKRQNAPGDAMAAHLDKQVTQKISQQREGAKIKCIWCDPGNRPSNRLYTVQEFLQEVTTAASTGE